MFLIWAVMNGVTPLALLMLLFTWIPDVVLIAGFVSIFRG